MRFKPVFVLAALCLILFCQSSRADSQSTADLLSGVARDNDLVIYLDSAPLKANARKAQEFAQSQKSIKTLELVKKLLGQMDY